MQEKLQHLRNKLASFRSVARALEEALASNPNEVRLLTNLGYNHINVQKYETAAATFEKALAGDPTLYRAAVGLGECFRQLGEFTKAAEVYEALFRKGNATLLVCANLSQLPKSLVNVDLLAALDEISRAPVTDALALGSKLAFVRASVFDKAGRYAQAWSELVAANDLKTKLLDRDYPERSKEEAEDPAPQDRGRGDPRIGRNVEEGAPHSLFVLGPSRSGKTTIEALVAGLPGVQRGFENVLITDIRQAFKGLGVWPADGLAAMTPEQRAMFRVLYLEELAGRTAEPVFTNTAPGLIGDALQLAEILPNARFIFVKRDINDIALRIFMKDYERDRNAYSYSLGETYGYVRRYYDRIDRLAAMLPDISRVVCYEDMIEDPKAVIDVAADLCGLSTCGGPLPQPPDDRGCAAPYRESMAAAGGDR